MKNTEGGALSITRWCGKCHRSYPLNHKHFQQAGFSLIELLIVVAIILIIAAISVPSLLAAKMSANEASAAASLSVLQKAMVQYQELFPLGNNTGTSNTTPDFSNIKDPSVFGGDPTKCPPNGAVTVSAACIISDLNLASTTPTKNGYTFLTGSFASGAFNAAAMPKDGTTWAFEAVPNSGTGGRKCYVIDQTNVMYNAIATPASGTGNSTCGNFSS